MPELPEAETLALELRRTVVGKRIVEVRFREPKALNLPPDEFVQKAKGRVEKVQRRAKAVALFLEGDGSLWLHMGLRSDVGKVPRNEVPPKAFLTLVFDDNSAFYMDKTFMGYAHFVSKEELPGRWAESGIDPLDEAFTPGKLKEIVASKPSQAIKSLLMDQSIIGGIGNIYSDEVLHAAGIYPARKCSTLSDEEVKRLQRAIREILTSAVDQGGGPEMRDFRGKVGGYKEAVHGREVCLEHDSPVKKISFGGRTAYVCEKAQG